MVRPPLLSFLTDFSTFFDFLQNPFQNTLLFQSKKGIIIISSLQGDIYLFYFIIHHFFKESKESVKVE